ncbi:MAG: glycosyltransferase family 4 protein [Salinibacterium sp.]|nr:glycosyltransferase family 4 protein [Salinibacterium sp.]
MKIIFDCRYTRLGRHDGISRYTARMVTELGKLHPVTMLISDEQQLTMLPELPWVLGPSPTGAREPLVALAVNAFEPDVVFTPMQTMGPIFRRYALVSTVHDLIYYTHRTPPRDLSWPIRLLWRGYHLSWSFQRALLNRADAHVVVSETTGALMVEHRLTRNPVTVIISGTDHPQSRPVRTPGRGLHGSRDLVYMGSFMPYKNVEMLATAMHDLPGYRLRLMSRISDSDRERLIALAPPGAVDVVNGATEEEYRNALLNSLALVTASKDEGFGLPIIEAQALGIPTVVSDIPIFREIAGAHSGFFDPSNIDEFVTAVRLLESEATWTARSAASFAWAQRFSWPAAAAQLLTVLTETVTRRRAH